MKDPLIPGAPLLSPLDRKALEWAFRSGNMSLPTSRQQDATQSEITEEEREKRRAAVRKSWKKHGAKYNAKKRARYLKKKTA